MELPILLLLLIAISGILSKLTTEKSPVSGQTTKRELLEGNFGVRTAVLNKYEPPNTTPGIEYTENFKQGLHQQSAAEQIFGSRIFPITKISDLLTGQSQPFDIALSNHLYAPVSVYNTKLQKLASPDEKSTIKPPKFDIHYSKPENPKPQGPYYVEEIRQKNTLSRKPNFHLPGILGSDFYTQESKYRELRPKPLTSTPEPQLYVYKEQFNFGPFIPIAYNQQQPPAKAKPEELGFDYENQEGSHEEKDRGLNKVATTNKTEKTNNPYIEARGFYSHPDGAISYSRFIHNQPLFEAQPDSQILDHVPTKTEQQTLAPKFHDKYKFRANINVPDPPVSTSKDDIVPQQYVPVSQAQHQLHQTTKQAPSRSGFHLENLSDPAFAIQQSPRHPIYYLHPIKKPYSQLLPNYALPTLVNRQHSLKPLPPITATLEPKYQATNHSADKDTPVTPSKQLLIPTQTSFTPQTNPQNSPRLLHLYTPSPATVTHYQSVVPLNTAPATIQPQVQNTPKYPLSVDQALQPTTTQPETISNDAKDIKSEPKHLPQESVSLTSPTLQPFLVSPVTLQSISSPTPEYYLSSTPGTEILTRAQQTHAQASPHHQVQIQQQNFQEIHSELAPDRQDSAQHLENLSQEKHQSSATTAEYQSTTAHPTETSSPDYEIEIASHIDHNQLPKDLQPITTVQATNNQIENHGQLDQQPYSQNKKLLLASRPYIVPIQSFGEPPSYQNINFHDPNSLFLGQSLATIQPFVQPRLFSNVQELVLQPHFQQTSSFPPVQYFGKYAQSIFGNI